MKPLFVKWWKQGATRNVFLIGKYAVKFPRLIEWRLFLCGLLANMQETNFWRQLRNERLCPVIFSIPGGWLIVMPRAGEFSGEDHENFDYEDFVNVGFKSDVVTLAFLGRETGWVIPVENKQDSFGWLDGRIVAVDYGS